MSDQNDRRHMDEWDVFLIAINAACWVCLAHSIVTAIFRRLMQC